MKAESECGCEGWEGLSFPVTSLLTLFTTFIWSVLMRETCIEWIMQKAEDDIHFNPCKTNSPSSFNSMQ